MFGVAMFCPPSAATSCAGIWSGRKMIMFGRLAASECPVTGELTPAKTAAPAPLRKSRRELIRGIVNALCGTSRGRSAEVAAECDDEVGAQTYCLFCCRRDLT